MVDQAALHGLLKKVRDLGMPLISVKGMNPTRPMRQMLTRMKLIPIAKKSYRNLPQVWISGG